AALCFLLGLLGDLQRSGTAVTTAAVTTAARRWRRFWHTTLETRTDWVTNGFESNGDVADQSRRDSIHDKATLDLYGILLISAV
ncbi:MAG TPA: hypothetical protein VK357_02025, partial [Rubrobacteraceae bacterium]|nr:hypothetical protein [Rubrobacteraceae bacterium]